MGNFCFNCKYSTFSKKRQIANNLSAFFFVDLGRIELPSKRGNHMLSTCLSLPSFFEYRQDQSHQPVPYPLNFRKNFEEELSLFPILLCRFTKRFGTRAFERHPVSATVAEIKVIYCSSITLREHKYCCQIIA